jgi:hypothetical protein
MAHNARAAHPYIQAQAEPPRDRTNRTDKALTECRTAWAEAFETAQTKGLNNAKAIRMAAVAYKLAMPKMDSLPSIRAAIACIAQGINLEIYDGRDGSQLLYAAQVALSVNAQKGREKMTPPTPTRQPLTDTAVWNNADDSGSRNEIDVDRAYIEGMRAGWNLAQGLSELSAYFPKEKNDAIAASNAKINIDFDAALNCRRREIAAPTAYGVDRNRHRNTISDVNAVSEQGPLVRQPPPAARLARILHHAAQELWDACTLQSSADMWEDARAIASRILAAYPKD